MSRSLGAVLALCLLLASVASGAPLAGISGSAVTGCLLYYNGTDTSCLTAPFTITNQYSGAYITAYSGNSASGDVDIYTVPANKVALCTGVLLYNATAGTITRKLQLKISSTYYVFTNPITGSTIAPNTAATDSTIPIVLAAGESLSYNFSALGVNVWASCYEMASTAPITRGLLTSVAIGDNTVYTVPNGKTAWTLALSLGTSFSVNSSTFVYSNTSGNSQTISWYISSGASSAATQISPSQTLTNNTINFRGASAVYLQAGTKIILNASTADAGQFAYVAVLEF